MNTAFPAITVSLFSGFFSLGAVTFLYIRFRTKILRLLLLFLSSLVLISLGSWLRELVQIRDPLPRGSGIPAEIRIWASILSLPGLALNVATVPFLVSALAAIPLEGGGKTLVLLWDFLVAAACLVYPFISDPAPILVVLDIQLVVTIAGSLIVLAVNLRHIGRLALRRALTLFLGISAAFLVLLILDILITRLEIRALSVVDGLSLPSYLLGLNIGSFFLAGRFLDSEPLVDGGRLTEACKAEFGLTAREAELIERLLDGSTNQDLADALCISRKTVENHLYNIFQKMGVRNRLQLVSVLKAWNKESWG
ncbi:MAG: helix-turn-helix transcriptional regulator [Treponema sp.]|nr:helix-turn-helix transcriptional regulator [Treponema sp.]